jgi:hypothetical protein
MRRSGRARAGASLQRRVALAGFGLRVDATPVAAAGRDLGRFRRGQRDIEIFLVARGHAGFAQQLDAVPAQDEEHLPPAGGKIGVAHGEETGIARDDGIRNPAESGDRHLGSHPTGLFQFGQESFSFLLFRFHLFAQFGFDGVEVARVEAEGGQVAHFDVERFVALLLRVDVFADLQPALKRHRDLFDGELLEILFAESAVEVGFAFAGVESFFALSSRDLIAASARTAFSVSSGLLPIAVCIQLPF